MSATASKSSVSEGEGPPTTDSSKGFLSDLEAPFCRLLRILGCRLGRPANATQASEPVVCFGGEGGELLQDLHETRGVLVVDLLVLVVGSLGGPSRPPPLRASVL